MAIELFIVLILSFNKASSAFLIIYFSLGVLMFDFNLTPTTNHHGNNISQHTIKWVAITSATLAITSANHLVLGSNNISYHGNTFQLQNSGNNINHNGNNISH